MKKKEKDDLELIKQEKNEKKAKVTGILFITWFIVTIGLMLYFSYMEQGDLLICLFGHYFAIFGFLAYKAEGAGKKLKDVWPACLFMFVGSVLMIGSLLYHFEIFALP